MRHIVVFFFVLTLSAGLTYASKPVHAARKRAVLKADSSAIVLRDFDDKAIKAYGQQEDFQYREVEDTPSYWTRFWRWFWHLFDFEKSREKTSNFLFYLLKFLQYTLLLAGAAAIVFFVLKLAGVDALNIFRRKPAAANLSYAEFTEDIHHVNFDGEIEKAVNAKNYRLAVRLLYLKCLKQLSDNALISWQPEKTNASYVNELNDSDLRQLFKSLTRRFEYIWYGDFGIDATGFKEISLLFQQFKNSAG